MQALFTLELDSRMTAFLHQPDDSHPVAWLNVSAIETDSVEQTSLIAQDVRVKLQNVANEVNEFFLDIDGRLKEENVRVFDTVRKMSVNVINKDTKDVFIESRFGAFYFQAG